MRIDRYHCETCRRDFAVEEAVDKIIVGRRMNIIEKSCPGCGRQLVAITATEPEEEI